MKDPPVIKNKSVRKGERLKSQLEKNVRGKRKDKAKEKRPEELTEGNEQENEGCNIQETSKTTKGKQSLMSRQTKRVVTKKGKKTKELSIEQAQEVNEFGAYEGERLI